MNFSLVKVLLNIIICLLSYLLYDFIKKNRNDWELVSQLDFKKYTNNVSTNEMLYNISKVIEKNERLNHTLDSLRKTLFFKIFKYGVNHQQYVVVVVSRNGGITGMCFNICYRFNFVKFHSFPYINRKKILVTNSVILRALQIQSAAAPVECR